jgi:tetratricopeptide (TPR) repeat protein
MAIIIITFGAVVALPGLRWLFLLLLFYQGQRRDLYFRRDQNWKRLAQLGSASLLYGLSIVTFGMRFYMVLMDFVSCCTFFLMLGLVAYAPALLKRYPPPWLRRLEDARSDYELAIVIEYGRAMLGTYPETFRQIIRAEDGWETWLLTIIEPDPMSRFDFHIIQAENALGNRNFQVARVIADDIIRTRPDRALGYQLRARALLGDYRFAEAAQAYDICIEMEPHNVDFYYRRARVHLMLDDMDAAHADLQRASELAPDDERLRVLRDIAAKRQAQLRAK